MRVRSLPLRRLGESFALTVVFLAACAVGLILHLNTPSAQRALAATVNDVLAATFAGSIRIETLGRVAPTGIYGTQLRVDDAQGHRILSLRGVNTRLGLIRTLSGVLLPRGPVAISIDELRTDEIVLALVTDDDGELSLAKAFASRHPGPPPKPSSGFYLKLGRVEFAHASIHAQLPGMPAFETDIESLRGTLSLAPNELAIRVEQYTLETRGLPHGADARGGGSIRIAVPMQTGSTMRTDLQWQGTVAGVPSSVEARVNGNAIEFALDAPQIHPDKIRVLWPASPIDQVGSWHVEGRGTLPSLDVRARATLGASSIDADGNASLADEKRLDLHVESRALDARSFSAQAPPSRVDLSGDLAIVLGATGSLQAEATLEVGGPSSMGELALPASTIRTSVVVQPTSGTSAEVTLDVREPGAPTRISCHLDFQNGSPVATFEASIHAPELAAVPRLRSLMRAAGHGAGTRRTESEAAGSRRAEGDAASRRGETEAAGRSESDAASRRGETEAAGRSESDAASRRGETNQRTGLLRGHATLATRGTVNIARGTVNANLNLDARDLSHDALIAKSASVRGRISGPMRAPIVDAVLDAQDLKLAGTLLREARVEIHGPIMGAALSASVGSEDGSRWLAHAKLDARDTIRLRDVEAVYERDDDVRVALNADLAQIRGEDIEVEEAVLSGLGSPVHASVRSRRGVWYVRANAEQLDLAHVGRLSSAAELRGRLGFNIDVALTSQRADGQLALNVEDVALGSLRGGSARLEARLKDRSIEATVEAKLGDAVSARMRTTSLTLAGSEPLHASLRRTSGVVVFESDVDLEKLDAVLLGSLQRLMSTSSLGRAAPQGKLALRGQITRGSEPDEVPSLELSATGTHLAMASPTVVSNRDHGGPHGAAADSPETELDLGVTLEIDGGTGASRFAGHLDDTAGKLAGFEVCAAKVPYAALFASGDPLRVFFEQVPLEARLEVPRRKLETVPGGIVPKGYRGEVEAEIAAQGTLEKPTVDIVAKIVRGRGAGMGAPIDADMRVQYDGVNADGKLVARIRDKDVLSWRTRVSARTADLLAAGKTGTGTGTGTWEASSEMHLLGFPIETLRALDDRQVRGTLTGELVLEGLHRDAKMKVALAATDLRIRDIPYGSAKLGFAIGPDGADGLLRFERQEAFAEARLRAGARWGSALSPMIDESQQLTATVAARQFPAAVLLPLVDETLADLDGQIDADARVMLDPRTRRMTTEGTLSVEKGEFELAGLSGGLHDISAKLALSPDGRIRIESVTARGVSGELKAAGTARLDRFGLAEAKARLEIPASDPLPVTVEGAGYGSIEGDLDISLARADNPKHWEVQADFGRMRVQLPITSTRSLQPLTPLENVQVGTRRNNEFISLAPLSNAAAMPNRHASTASGSASNTSNTSNAPSTSSNASNTSEISGTTKMSGTTKASNSTPSDEFKVEIAVNLGQDVEIKRGTTLEVALAGNPTITLGETAEISGQVRLLRGVVDVQGKSFDIEEGTITFVGDDPTNPQAIISAGWTAPDGTRVHAQFVGPLKTGKVTLSSEPQLPKNDILALLLFGTPDGARASSRTRTTPGSSSAAGFAGNTAAQPLNRALQDFGLGGVSTRIDSSSANLRPEVEVQIARDIALQVAWVLGAPAPGSRPDRTLFTLDWRFIRRWSLQTTIGDAGTSIFDLVWQYRY